MAVGDHKTVTLRRRFDDVCSLVQNAGQDHHAIGGQRLGQGWIAILGVKEFGDHFRQDIGDKDAELAGHALRHAAEPHVEHTTLARADAVERGIFHCSVDGNGVNVGCQQARGAQLVRYNGEHAGAAADIQHAVAWLHDLFERNDAQPRGGVQPRAKGHAGVQLDHNVVVLRGELLPAWLEHHAAAHAQRLVEFFPGVRPVFLTQGAHLRFGNGIEQAQPPQPIFDLAADLLAALAGLDIGLDPQAKLAVDRLAPVVEAGGFDDSPAARSLARLAVLIIIAAIIAVKQFADGLGGFSVALDGDFENFLVGHRFLFFHHRGTEGHRGREKCSAFLLLSVIPVLYDLCSLCTSVHLCAISVPLW